MSPQYSQRQRPVGKPSGQGCPDAGVGRHCCISQPSRRCCCSSVNSSQGMSRSCAATSWACAQGSATGGAAATSAGGAGGGGAATCAGPAGRAGGAPVAVLGAVAAGIGGGAAVSRFHAWRLPAGQEVDWMLTAPLPSMHLYRTSSAQAGVASQHRASTPAKRCRCCLIYCPHATARPAIRWPPSWRRLP